MGRAGDVVRRYLAAARAGDWDTAFGLLAQDVIFRVPGRSRHAGEHRGRDAAIAYIEAARAASHRGEVRLELVDVLESEARVALLLREEFDLPEGPVVIRRANVYRVAGGEIAEVWIFEGDQYEVDALLA